MSETTAGIRIFDSLTHPTPTGNWLDRRDDGAASAEGLVQQMNLCGVERVLAVGMGDSVGGYTEADYASWVRDAVPGSTPIAFVPFDERDQSDGLSDHLGRLRELGYLGVKIHPRLTRTTFGDPRLVEVLAAAALYDLRVLVCSYNFGHPDYASGELGPAYLMAAIDAAPGAKVIVLHGGACNVLEWSEWVRPRHDVLLDLSFTIARYAGSSVDLDLEYLFDSLDERLCVGSDHPQFDLFTLRQRFDKFAGGISREKADRIAFGNLARFFPEDGR